MTERINNKRIKIKEHIPFIILMVLLALVWIILAVRKDIWFCDEVYSYESANSGIYYYLNPLDASGTWTTGEALSTYLTKGEKVFNFLEVEKYLYTDHVPFYFLVLRVFSLCAYGILTKWTGLAINLICYILTAVMIYKYLRSVRVNNVVSALGTAAVCLHPILLSQATIIRMYMMLTLFELLFVFLVDRFREKSEKGIKTKDVFISLVLLGIATAFGILTHFYFWLFVFVYSVLFGIFMLYKKRGKQLIAYIATMISSLILSSVLYPLLWKRVLLGGNRSEKMTGAFSAFVDVSLLKEKFVNLGKGMFSECFPDIPLSGGLQVAVTILFSLIIVAVIVFAVIKALKTGDEKKISIVIPVVTSFLVIIVIGWVSPEMSERYFWSPMTILAVFLLTLILGDTGHGKKQIITVGTVLSVILCACIFSSMHFENIDWLCARTTEEKNTIKKEASGKTWAVFADEVDYTLHCSFYDFAMAGDIMRISETDSVENDVVFAGSDEIVFYTFEGYHSAEECREKIERAAGRTAGETQYLGKSGYMSVYLLKMQ